MNRSEQTVFGRPFVPAPWPLVEDLRSRLLSSGIQCVACYDGQTRKAGFEILDGTDPGRVRELLVDWSAATARGPGQTP